MQRYAMYRDEQIDTEVSKKRWTGRQKGGQTDREGDR